jgi:hypothetical protein
MWFEPARAPDELIGDKTKPLIRRWYICRKSKIPFVSKLLENVYLHNVVRNDDDRAPHDHPWWNISIVLWGGYYEHMPLYHYGYVRGYERRTRKVWRGMGSVVFRKAENMHRLELPTYAPKQTWTLFITGKKSREWGFWCQSGWKHWTLFGEKGCS